MTVSFHSSDDRRLHAMERSQANALRSSRRLASGSRIAIAADDAAGLAIAERLRGAIAGGSRLVDALRDGRDVADVADGALQTSQDNLARMRELAVQAGNGALGSSERAALQQEYDQLAAALDQTAAGTSFGGVVLLDGSGPAALTVPAADGDSPPVAVALPDARASTLGVAGRDVADPSTVARLDAASSSLADARTELGAFRNAAARRANHLEAAAEAAVGARSRIADVDVAQEVANLTRHRILAALQLGGQLAEHGATSGRLDHLA